MIKVRKKLGQSVNVKIKKKLKKKRVQFFKDNFIDLNLNKLFHV